MQAKSKGKKTVDEEAVRECAHRISEATLGHLLEHVRRGKVAPLWEAVLELTEQDVTSADMSQRTGALHPLLRMIADVRISCGLIT